MSLFKNYFNESTTPLGISATLTGTSRDIATVYGSYTSFGAFVLTDQVGTLSLEGSNDGTTWYTITSAAIVASTPLHLSTPIRTRYHRVKLVNSTSAQTTLVINSSYL